jgi:predicted nucleotidyltransferase component of viral defense system
MINKQEIMEEAKKHNLPPNIIEKDYVLSWILAGISESKQLKDDWIFKGGTCLKKCYFETYRFSEDLDFTIINMQHRNPEYLKTVFGDIAEWTYEQIGLELPDEAIRFESYNNPRGELSIQGKIAYKGPMQRRGSHSTIKLDLCWDEIVVEPPIMKTIYHPYSDANFNFKAQTYCVEEIFAEKLRAFVERMRPRDLYDIIHLFNDTRWSPDRGRVLAALRKKCAFKAVEVPTLELVNAMPGKSDLIADWDNMLVHQISNLEAPGYYWKKLLEIFHWLYQ